MNMIIIFIILNTNSITTQ